MSIFNVLLPKLDEISNAFTRSINEELKGVFDCFDKFEEDYHNDRNRAREKAPKDKNVMTTLQSINEDEDNETKTPESDKPKRRSSNKTTTKQNLTEEKTIQSFSDSNPEKPKRVSKKRNKDEVDGISSPEQPDKRTKRNASVKAQSIISKQVNVNLSSKMRRDDTQDKTKSRRKGKEEDKENTEPSVILVKQEKESLPPESMDVQSVPLDINVKVEQNKDEISMPPPLAPVPKSRRTAREVQKDKSEEHSEDELSTTRSKRTVQTKKQTDMPPPASRATRASSRASGRKQREEETQPTAEARPKRTRGRKKLSDRTASSETINDSSQTPISSVVSSPAEKPRPKRTKRGQKATENHVEEQQKQIEIKQERLTEAEISSPILTKSKTNATKSKIQQNDAIDSTSQVQTNINHIANETKSKIQQNDAIDSTSQVQSNINHIANETKTIIDSTVTNSLDETRVISKEDLDKTTVLPNGVYNHDATEAKNAMNETVVIEKQKAVMNSTVVLEKETIAANITEDNSILTDDNDDEPHTPPKKDTATVQPTSAVKEKVQQFEELASRVTRTKTRAMAKREEQTENVTPPDKINKAILDVDTLTKMNSLIFNGATSHGQISSSACKPRSHIPITKAAPSSTSKLCSLGKHRDAAEESLVGKEQDARKKKEAMLEAKREMQKRKREEKMAAAAAARLAADKERAAAALAAERERADRLALLDHAKMERRKDLERKKQELARKVAETEERRRAEEQQRLNRITEEQRRAELTRKKQIQEQEITKKEAALMAKEIEVKQRMYIEKQKMKQYQESKGLTPLKTFGTPPGGLEPVYMQDGFQFLNSDEDDDPPERMPPAWAVSKVRKKQLMVQSQVSSLHVDRLFSVRVHSPDLREIFPAIERARLKRTSSAVWRTPPRLHLNVCTDHGGSYQL